jgi:16S rRNA (uracil1498-N3)-methyltransferase
LNLVLAETERDIMLSDLLRAQTDLRYLTLASGPEGGWTPEELQDFATAQFVACSLGGTILRAETAAIAALAVARSEI